VREQRDGAASRRQRDARQRPVGRPHDARAAPRSRDATRGPDSGPVKAVGTVGMVGAESGGGHAPTMRPAGAAE
jgi:hypothetical protein